MRLCWLLITAGLALAADVPKVSYSKVFPGSDPAYMAISVNRTGAATYREDAKDDEPEVFTVEADAVQAIFDLAEKLEHFKRPLESGLKVARTGDKTFRWDNGPETSEAKFNYSLDEDAKALQEWFEHISESERALVQLRRAIRFDKLGVNDAVIRVDSIFSQKRLVGFAQFLPLLDRIAKNESFINLARERAGRLADQLRTAGKVPQ